MFDIKVNFKKKYKQDAEMAMKLFSMFSLVKMERSFDNTTLYSISVKQSITKLREIAKHLIRYEKYREMLI